MEFLFEYYNVEGELANQSLLLSFEMRVQR